MTRTEREHHMVRVVQPRMRALFQDFDGARFQAFGCPTCHGPGASNGSYTMPNPALEPLEPALFYRAHRKAQPEIAHFMWKSVEPTMADLLGLPRGKSGVHCGTCHPQRSD